MTDNPKDIKRMERILKGAANSWRIRILFMLKAEPDLSLIEVSDKLKINFKNVSEHIRKLAIAGLVTKKYDGIFVRHKLTKRGDDILTFYRMLE
jgi:DNA-binding transcriptional ArsR family regulator